MLADLTKTKPKHKIKTRNKNKIKPGYFLKLYSTFFKKDTKIILNYYPIIKLSDY